MGAEVTVTDTQVAVVDPKVGHQLRRLLNTDGELYLNVSDLIYLTDASKERFQVEQNPDAADAMERLTFVLSMLALVTPV